MTNAGWVGEMLATIGDDIACRHRFEVDSSIDFALLSRLGLVAALNTRIPRCEDHGCPLLGSCRFQADFGGRQSGRSGRKFRRTAIGQAAAVDPSFLRRVVNQELALLYDLGWRADQTITIFELAAGLLTRDLDRIDGENSSSEKGSYSRRELGALLHLLADLGVIQVEPDGITLRWQAHHDEIETFSTGD